ncbi:MAG: TRAP transporter small permease subunit, partial [Candidatus Thorarchaeota archaeon]
MFEKLLASVEKVCEWVFKFAGWLVLPLIAIQTFEVVMRYGFDSPTIWAFEMSRFIGGSLFVLGMAYALFIGAHIRVDIFYKRWSIRTQSIVDLAITAALVIPVLILSLDRMIDWTVSSWQIAETSSDTAWRVPLYPFKTVMPASIFLLLMAVLATAARQI